MKCIKILSLLVYVWLFSTCTFTKSRGDDIRLWNKTNCWDFAKYISEHNFAKAEKLLDTNKINIDHQEPMYGETLLHWAVLNNDFDAVRFLVEHGANPNAHDTFSGESPVILAASHYTVDIKILGYLLSRGGNPNDYVQENEKVSNGRSIETPLTSAAFTDLEKTKLLIKAGANVDFSVMPGYTALSAAEMKIKCDVLEYLFFECKANYRKAFVITISGDSIDFVSLLKKKNALTDDDKIIIDSILENIETNATTN